MLNSYDTPYFMSHVIDDDWMDNPGDAQETFNLISSAKKELFWIEGTNRRFDGDNYKSILSPGLFSTGLEHSKKFPQC
ncbi:hypothetical protein [Endozoicomonas sp. SCSIO W0465]|uniref:hypothetical protein n=1 Tax=Endozoicomonas sp. SCSIO W0465 TaxID=2918516 RepID=UPI0020764230|nr:hypothetical protein [Endozoicomonas sp. SCSIO W0465]USE38301.1 hypothetical protein MJO57_09120 [Endozoicomonas sp. SCSIO W0465]